MSSHLIIAGGRVWRESIAAKIEEARALYERTFPLMRKRQQTLASALLGGCTLSVVDNQASAAVLNAAAVGTAQRTVTVCLVDAKGDTVDWADGVPLTLTPGYTGATGAAPTVAPTSLVKGKATLALTLITDAGATKTYANAEACWVDVDLPGPVLNSTPTKRVTVNIVA